jgi:hypothetical protein
VEYFFHIRLATRVCSAHLSVDVFDESGMEKDEKVAIISTNVINPVIFDQALRIFIPHVPAGTSASTR